MDTQKIDMFLLVNGKYFESYQLPMIKEKLLQLDEAQWNIVQMTQFKDPTTALIVSIVGGSLGIDRFFIGDTGLGIAKLLTCGGIGIWTIVDWFLITGVTKEKNMLHLQQALSY